MQEVQGTTRSNMGSKTKGAIVVCITRSMNPLHISISLCSSLLLNFMIIKQVQYSTNE